MLNLTPFLTHNLNLMNGSNSAGNISNNVNFTPFYDKSLHLTDFFIDSPLRPSPSRAVETITPSRFAIGSEKKSLEPSLEPMASLKRSITQIDTPARHPFKKSDSMLGKANDDDLSDSDNENDSDNKDKSFDDHFVTPSKKNVLKDTSHNLLNKTPLKSTPNNSTKDLYRTPAKPPPQMSSPSTVIVSSGVKSPEDNSDKKNIVPPSPTPNKEKVDAEGSTEFSSEPIMGIFSEKKAKAKAEQSSKRNNQPKKSNRKQPPGTNRFQIVFTDVHTLMNSKKKKDAEPERRNDRKKPQRNTSFPRAVSNPSSTQVPHVNILAPESLHPSQHPQHPPQHSQHPQHHLQHQHPPAFAFHHSSSSLSASQDFNTTVNSSKEFSMVGNNSTVNTTNQNLNFSSNEHSSFEMANPGMVSTPNRKYLLDNSFDKASPQAINQMTSSFNHFNVRQLEGLRQDESIVYHGAMPPPKSMMYQNNAHHAVRQAEQPHSHSLGMNMMMSTPQHASVSSHNFFLADDVSPSNKESMSLLYQQLHQFDQVGQNDHTPNDELQGLHGKTRKGY